MAKKINPLILAGGAIILIVAALFIVGGFPFAITPVFDSDLLSLSGSPTYLSGQNQPIQGDVVQSSYAVGAGNDITVVGAFDEESVSASNVPGDFENPAFFITGRKLQMETLIPLSADVGIVQEPIVLFEQVRGFSAGLLIDDAERLQIQRATAENAYNDCQRRDGYISFGWEGDVDFVTGFPSEFFPQIRTVCIDSIDSVLIEGLGSKTTRMNLEFELRNADGEVTSKVNLTESSVEGFFTSGFETIGHVKWAGNLLTLEFPIDISDETMGTHNGIFSSYSLSRANIAIQQTGELRNLAFERNAQLFNEVQFKANDLQTSWNNFIGSRSSRIDGREFTYDLFSNSVVIDTRFTSNPVVTLIVKGSWIGILRNVASFRADCGNPVNGETSETLASSVLINNVSNVFGDFQMSYACPGGARSIHDNLSGGQSRRYDIPLTFSRIGTGACEVTVSWAGQSDSCFINYDISERPVLCGNGIVDSGEECDGGNLSGETCVTQEFDSGQLACFSVCKFDTSNCGGPPPPPPVEIDIILIILAIVALVLAYVAFTGLKKGGPTTFITILALIVVIIFIFAYMAGIFVEDPVCGIGQHEVIENQPIYLIDLGFIQLIQIGVEEISSCVLNFDIITAVLIGTVALLAVYVLFLRKK